LGDCSTGGGAGSVAGRRVTVPLRLVCPHTTVTPETRAALEGLDVEYINVGADDEAYWRLLSELWADQEDFCVVEQDVVAPPGFLYSFDACDHEWCAYSYRYKTWDEYVGLGCVRFRSSLMVSEPDLLVEVGNMVIGSHPRKHWCTLDSGIQRWLGRYQRRAHVHGVCEHVGNGTPSHGCV
jgi:hypothetical protein